MYLEMTVVSNIFHSTGSGACVSLFLSIWLADVGVFCSWGGGGVGLFCVGGGGVVAAVLWSSFWISPGSSFSFSVEFSSTQCLANTFLRIYLPSRLLLLSLLVDVFRWSSVEVVRSASLFPGKEVPFVDPTITPFVSFSDQLRFFGSRGWPFGDFVS